MAWTQQKKFVPRLVEPHNIKLVSGRTQFVPLQRYHKRQQRFPVYYQACLHLLAGYGLIKLVLEVL